MTARMMLLICTLACQEAPLTRPADADLEWATSAPSAEVVEPSTALKNQGVSAGDPMAAEHFNYLLRGSWNWIEHLVTPADYIVVLDANPANWLGNDGTNTGYGLGHEEVAAGNVRGIQKTGVGATGYLAIALPMLIPVNDSDFESVTIKSLDFLLKLDASCTVTTTLERQPNDGSAGWTSVDNITFSTTRATPLPASHPISVALDPDYGYRIKFEANTTAAGVKTGAQWFAPTLTVTRAPGE